MFRAILADIRVIRKNDPAARHWLEVITCYPGLHALCLHRLAHLLWCCRLKWLARFLSFWARLWTQIEIHPAARIGAGVFIDHGSGVVIGATAEVGPGCTIYQGVTLGGTSLERGVKRHPTLEEGVIVGAGAKILGPFTVGRFSKVGSNAVLLHALPPYATAVGNPAHIVGERPSPAVGAVDACVEEPFYAYGVTSKSEDPLWQALKQQADEIERLKKSLLNIKTAGN